MSPEWKIILSYFSFNLGLLITATIIGFACFITLYKKIRNTQTFTPFTLFIYSVTIGFTAIITLLFLLALSDLLTKNIIFSVLALAATSSFIYTARNYSLIQGILINQYTNKPEKDLYILSLSGIFLLAALCVLTNVHVTGLYDGTSYHLPYAQFYLDHHGLATNINLRYPYQSHNGNLLYSFALTFADSIYCQTLHALFGVLTALVIFAMALTAGIASPLAMICAASFLSLPIFLNASTSADVDLFSCFFVVMSIYTSIIWQKDESNRIAFIISALSIAMAIGTKYISLLFLLLLGIYIIFNSYRTTRSLFIYALVATLFGSWWYLRSFLLIGNPVHPFALDIFGYALWNTEDSIVQHHDLAYNVIGKNIINFITLPRFFNNDSLAFTGLQYSLYGFYIAPFFWKKLSTVSKSLMWFTWPFLLFWFLSGQIWRYIIPLAPLIIVICFDLIQVLLRELYHRLQKMNQSTVSLEKLQPVFVSVIILFVLQKSVLCLIPLKNVSQWPITPASQDAFLKKYSPEYQLISVANLNFDKSQNIFLFDFFQLNYFLKANAIGEHFGPNRVRDIINLVVAASNEPDTPDNSALKSLMDQFTARHIDGFIIDNRITYNQQLLNQHFERLYSNSAGAIYRIHHP